MHFLAIHPLSIDQPCQMALISGQSAPMSTISPGSTSSELVGVKGVGSVGTIGSSDPHGTVCPSQSFHDIQLNLAHGLPQSLSQQQSHDGETQSGPHAFSGLPTPGKFLFPFLF